MSNAGQRAEDRGLIQDALAKYVWGYDEGDFALLADSFTEDAVAFGKVANTDLGWGPMRGRAEIVGTLQAIRAGQSDQRRHTISSFLFDELTADRARVSCMLVLVATENGTPRLVSAGWYRCKLVKEADTWRMSEQEALLDSPF